MSNNCVTSYSNYIREHKRKGRKNRLPAKYSSLLLPQRLIQRSRAKRSSQNVLKTQPEPAFLLHIKQAKMKTPKNSRRGSAKAVSDNQPNVLGTRILPCISRTQAISIYNARYRSATARVLGHQVHKRRGGCSASPKVRCSKGIELREESSRRVSEPYPTCPVHNRFRFATNSTVLRWANVGFFSMHAGPRSRHRDWRSCWTPPLRGLGKPQDGEGYRNATQRAKGPKRGAWFARKKKRYPCSGI